MTENPYNRLSIRCTGIVRLQIHSIRERLFESLILVDSRLLHILLRQVLEGPGFAVIGVAECVDVMAEAMCDRQQQSVVGLVAVLQGAPHLEAQTAAYQHERNVVECVRVPLAQLVRPHDRRVIQQRALTVRLGSFGESLREVGELLAEPFVDFCELVL